MIDARGQLCPMPVIMVQKAAKENPAEIQVLVDDPCAVDNITRFAGNNGYQITSAPQGEDYLLILRKYGYHNDERQGHRPCLSSLWMCPLTE